jgi:hypothetical protein
MERLARSQVKTKTDAGAEDIFSSAMSRFSAIHAFCKGDLSQDIYSDLIHNENNMRPSELNGLFKVSGLDNVCRKSSDKQSLLDAFGSTDADSAHGKLVSSLENFFERRNGIAHALIPKL